MLIKKRSFSITAAYLLHCCILISCQQQANKITDETITMRIPVSVKDSLILSIDKSPMDMSYFPDDYPKQKMLTPNLARSCCKGYLQPAAKKRKNNFCRFSSNTKFYSALWAGMAIGRQRSY